MTIDNDKSHTPAPKALRLTREADAAISNLAKVAGPGVARHRLMVASITHGARALAADPVALLRLLVGNNLAAAVVGEPTNPAPIVPPPVAPAAPVAEVEQHDGIPALVAAVKKAGGELVITSRDAAKIVGRSSHSMGQWLGHERDKQTGALHVEQMRSTNEEGKGFRTRWRLTIDTGSSAAAPRTPEAQRRVAASPTRRARDEAYDAYLANVAVVVAKKPGRSVEWSCGDLTRRVSGRPATNNRGIANMLATMARNGAERCGLRVAATGEDRGGLAVYRFTATVPT